MHCFFIELIAMFMLLTEYLMLIASLCNAKKRVLSIIILIIFG